MFVIVIGVDSMIQDGFMLLEVYAYANMNIYFATHDGGLAILPNVAVLTQI